MPPIGVNIQIPFRGLVTAASIGEETGLGVNLQALDEVLVCCFLGTILNTATLDISIQTAPNNAPGAYIDIPGFVFDTKTTVNSRQVLLKRLNINDPNLERFIRVKTTVAGDFADHAVGFIDYNPAQALDLNDTKFEFSISRGPMDPIPPFSPDGTPQPVMVSRGAVGPISLEMKSLGSRNRLPSERLDLDVIKYELVDDQYVLGVGFTPLGIL